MKKRVIHIALGIAGIYVFIFYLPVQASHPTHIFYKIAGITGLFSALLCVLSGILWTAKCRRIYRAVSTLAYTSLIFVLPLFLSIVTVQLLRLLELDLLPPPQN